MIQGVCFTRYRVEILSKKEFLNPISVVVPDFRHHEAMLHHQRVADGRHHGENLLAGWVPPHQVEQGIGLVLTVQLVDTLLRDQLHRDSAVLLEDKDIPFRNKTLFNWSINSEYDTAPWSLWGVVVSCLWPAWGMTGYQYCRRPPSRCPLQSGCCSRTLAAEGEAPADPGGTVGVLPPTTRLPTHSCDRDTCTRTVNTRLSCDSHLIGSPLPTGQSRTPTAPGCAAETKS